jgi:hypothetical protein
MLCGNFLLCHMSQYQTITNNHNGEWKSILRKKIMSKNFHNSMLHILING